MSLDPQAPISALGEDGVVALLREWFPPRTASVGIGDDAAVLPWSAGSVVATTDTLVQGVDFDLAYVSGEDLGWKALAVNLSDAAAMGALPVYALATLCAPADMSIGLLTEVAQGLAECAGEYGVDIVGGDISRANEIAIGVALLARSDRPVLRSGARPGQAICVTGSLGGAAAGLAMLQRDRGANAAAVQRQLRPTPRVREGAALAELGVHSMIDLSDGLVVDLDRLVRASGCGCSVDLKRIPVDEAVSGSEEARRMALYGGEDFELLFTVEPARVQEVVDALGKLDTPVHPIGHTTDGPALLDETPLAEMREEAWDHLRNR